MSNSRGERRLPDVAGARTIEQLRSVREQEQNRLAAALLTSPADEVNSRLNGLHDALIIQALKLAENELARMGRGAPPVPYAYMLYGSGGRLEQTLSSDQDSGLVYADAAGASHEESVRSYFRDFANTAVDHLIKLGYPPCEGNVIASNPEWCMSLGEWQSRLDGWYAEPSWENVRYLLIAADGRPLFGEADLAFKLKDTFFENLVSHPVIDQRMMENTLRHKVLVGVFGQLLTERYGDEAGSLDIKYGAYIPMVNAVRLLAVRAGIRETSTSMRVAALRAAGLMTEEEADDTLEAFTYFLKLRLMTTAVNEDGQWVGTGRISREQLTKETIEPLKKALKAGKKLQRRVQRELQHRFGER